jgi:spermidine synthase
MAGLLFAIYKTSDSEEAVSKIRRWKKLWEFSPEALGGLSYRSLVLVSFLSLFLEMLVIRWISAEIRIFAYFKNFVLIACFLGFGLGACWCRRKVNLLPTILPLIVLTLMVQSPWTGLREVLQALTTALGEISEVQVWGVPSVPLTTTSLAILLYAIVLIIPLFSLLALIFIPLGQMVGWYLENGGRGTWSYSVNVLASLGGICLYTLLCFASQPPWVWFTAVGVLMTALLWRAPVLRWTSLMSLGACAALLSWNTGNGTVYWSPYQKLRLFAQSESGRIISFQLGTNDTWYQQIIDLSPDFVSAHPNLFSQSPVELNAYNIPYRFYPRPPSVLVLGAGMGNDVAAALRNGAERVTAVEIDPLILSLGKRFHFEKPYDSPKVEVVLDDARSYVQGSRSRFDLIVFSLLDSHTTTSHFSNIRIDNYVYTMEALRAARQLLQPDGIFIIKFQVDTPWVAGRLQELLRLAFDATPLCLEADYVKQTTSGRFFVTGSTQRIAEALDGEFGKYVREHSKLKTEEAAITTDDWPYFYQHEPGLPASVIGVSATLMLVCWLAVRKTGLAGPGLYWHFFFLGAGFLLLEVQIISRMALLFGTTWVVNSFVISGILLLIVAANLLVEKAGKIPVVPVYFCLLLSLAIAYCIPLERLFFSSVWLRVFAATGVLCLPAFFAGILFVQSFSEVHFRGEALGSNLLGALAGGLIESLSLWTGLKSLLLVAVLMYLASYFFRVRPVSGSSPIRPSAH